MTAKESNTKKAGLGKYFSYSVRSYWWLGVIAAIAYGIAGPLVLWMGLASMSDISQEILHSRYQQVVTEWFHLTGVISYYIIAAFLAVVFALVIWSYLHSKKQINFYHSMPITRKTLFLNNILVGIAINFIPLLIMYFLMVIIGIGYAGVGAITWSWIFLHLLRIFLFFMLSYSLAVLAAQLTGTVLTQFGMSAVLHFGLLAFLGVAALAMQTFWGTFDGNAAFDKIWPLSPLTNMVYWFSTEQYYYSNGIYQSLDGLGLKWTAEIIIITIIAFVLAFLAYRKRHSESAGQALIYKFTQPIVEFILMFCISTLAAIAFLEISGKFFFLIGLVLFAVLTHMFCQVIFNKDFKAMFAAKKYLLGFLAALLLFFGAMYGDILGYDTYVPASDKISAIKIDLNDLDNSRNSYDDEESNIYTDSNDIELLLGIANQITEKGYFWRNTRLHDNLYLDEFDNSELMRLEYTYITSSGREISRQYGSVPVEAFKADFTALYNRESFKQVNYAWILEAKVRDLNYISVDSLNGYIYNQGEATSQLPFAFYWSNGSNNGMNNFNSKYGEDFLNALKQDIMNRKVEDLLQPPLYSGNIELKKIEEDSYDTRYRYYAFVIYPSDSNTLAFLAQLEAQGMFVTTDFNLLAENIRALDVYEVEMEKAGNIQTVIYGGYQYIEHNENLAESGLVKTETITDKAEIARILALAANDQQYDAMSKFKEFRNDIFIGVRFNDYVESSTYWDRGLILPLGAEI